MISPSAFAQSKGDLTKVTSEIDPFLKQLRGKRPGPTNTSGKSASIPGPTRDYLTQMKGLLPSIRKAKQDVQAASALGTKVTQLTAALGILERHAKRVDQVLGSGDVGNALKLAKDLERAQQSVLAKAKALR